MEAYGMAFAGRGANTNWEANSPIGHGTVDGFPVTWVAVMGVRRLGITTDGRGNVEVRLAAGLREAL